jgi:hypothetical protein
LAYDGKGGSLKETKERDKLMRNQPLRQPIRSQDTDRLAQLKLLDELHEAGTLTDEEFEMEKQRILRS